MEFSNYEVPTIPDYQLTEPTLTLSPYAMSNLYSSQTPQANPLLGAWNKLGLAKQIGGSVGQIFQGMAGGGGDMGAMQGWYNSAMAQNQANAQRAGMRQGMPSFEAIRDASRQAATQDQDYSGLTLY